MKNALVLLASASSFFFSGCVSTPSTVTSGPLRETRVDLRHSGRVAVVAFSSAAEVNVLMPANKTEAVRDAADGFQLLSGPEAKTIAAGFGYPLAGAAFFTVPVVVPAIAAVAGGIDTLQSWVRAEPEHKLAPTREALQAAVAGVRLETLVRDRQLTELRGETAQPLVPIDDATLREIDPTLPERAWRNDAGLSLKARQSLAARGLHRVLEIKVHAPALIAPRPSVAISRSVPRCACGSSPCPKASNCIAARRTTSVPRAPIPNGPPTVPRSSAPSSSAASKPPRQKPPPAWCIIARPTPPMDNSR